MVCIDHVYCILEERPWAKRGWTKVAVSLNLLKCFRNTGRKFEIQLILSKSKW